MKDKWGTGHYVRNQHELLLIAAKGSPPHPADKDKPPSVFYAKRRRHSEKPEAAYEIIERMYPDLPKLEMFARAARKGWSSWGNEARPHPA